MLIIALIGWGIYDFQRLPIDAVPDITNNQVMVITQAPSYGVLDIERLVTFPVEQACSNIAGTKEIRSFSRFGLSLVTIVFEDNVDVYWARQQVSERLMNAKSVIPDYIGIPEIGPITTGLGEVYQYVVRPKEGYEHRYDITQLRTIQDWIIRRQLMGVKGIAEVSSFGGKLKQYEVNINPQQLKAMGISIEEIFAALEKNNQNTGGGYVEKGPNVVFIRTEGLIKHKEDIENIPILRSNGNKVLLRDIASVNLGYTTRYGALCYNDKGEAAGGIVMMLKGANSSEVIKNIKERIAQIQKTLPEGVVIEPFLDRTKMVNNAIHTVRNNLIEGALIVIFVLVVFLGNLRAGLIVASVIPLSLLFAIIMMNLFGVSGNLMSLGALDFGLIVDGAVIIVEAVMHQLTHSMQKNNAKPSVLENTIVHTSHRMMKSALFGQLIILMVYIPIFSLEGIEGKMFKPMAQTVSFALLGAFLLSITYVPMMSAWLLHHKMGSFQFSDRWMARIETFYLRFLKKAVVRPKQILLASLVLFILSIAILTQLGGEFIPTLEEGDFAVDTRVLTGSNLNTTIEYTQKAAHILKSKFPEVEKVVTKIGSGEVPTDPMPMEASDMMVILKDKSEWTSASSFNELAEKMSHALESVAGITYGFQYPVQMRFNELMTGARQDVVCKIFGENLDTLAHYANILGKFSGDIQGAESIYVEPISGMPQMVVQYDRQQLVLYGIDIQTANNVVNTALAGKASGMVFEDEKRFNLVLRLDEKYRTIDEIQNLVVPTNNGQQVLLRQIAQIDLINGPNQIQREDAKRRIVVGFNVRNRDVQSVVNELKSKVENHIKLPSGYYIHYGGAFENLEQATQRLSIVVPISLCVIFIMLYFLFHKIKLAGMIFTAIPLSAMGGIWFLALRGMPFSISAGIGFIALFGVAVLNGIVLIAEFNRRQLEGETDLYQVVFEGAKTRLRPVLMTAMVASLGFFPMAFSQGSGAEVQRPLATVVIGGLLVATLLTLFVLPILYLLIESKSNPFMSKKNITTALLIFGIGLSAYSQSTIQLSAAIDTAIVRNQLMRNAELKAKIQKELIHSSVVIPKTNIGLDIGRYNSIYFDNKIAISQTIPFPTSFASQKKLKTDEYNLALLERNLTANELKKEVAKTFLLYVVGKKKEKIWKQQDSIMSHFVQKTKLKFERGDVNLLEKTSAELQYEQVKNELAKNAQELMILGNYFQFLLNTSYAVLPEWQNLSFPTIPPNNAVWAAPILDYQKQKINLNMSELSVLKSYRHPDIVLGFASTTIQGMGADNNFYSTSTRFNSGTIGLQVPLFPAGIQSKIKATKIQHTLLENELEYKENLLAVRYKNFYTNYTLYNDLIKKYEAKELKNAMDLLQLAHRQVLAGEIDYLQWSVVAQQSIQVHFQYIDVLAKYYENYLELLYSTIQN